MKTFLRKSGIFAIVFVMANLFFSSAAFGQEILSTVPIITSDKGDYAPGELATFTGNGFTANEKVSIQVLHHDETPNYGEGHDTWEVTADGTGAFTTTWIVCADDCFGSTLRAYAKGQTSLLEAFVEFTDGINKQPINTLVCAGIDATFIVTLSGGGASSASYKWFLEAGAVDVLIGTVSNITTTASNGVYSIIRDANSSTLTIDGTPISLSGNGYYVEVNQEGTVTSSTATLTVNPAPTIFNVDFNLAALCGGNFQVTLSGSEIGVFYTLYSQNNPNIETLIGTGNPLQFNNIRSFY